MFRSLRCMLSRLVLGRVNTGQCFFCAKQLDGRPVFAVPLGEYTFSNRTLKR